MVSFAVVGHHATTSGEFSLNDMPGGAGRLDILCRCINTSFFLSHTLRRDVECWLILCGPPDPVKTVLLRGSELKYLSPDERSAGSLLKKALSLPCGDEFRVSTPGIYIRRGGLERMLMEGGFGVLDETGEDIRKSTRLPERFLLSDHCNFTDEELAQIGHSTKFSVGPRALHADHTISVVLNELDRRESGWS